MRLQTFKRAAAAGAVLVALYAAAGYLLAPWLAQRYLPSLLEQRIGRNVSVGEFRANPFLLTFEAHQISIDGKHGRPILAADEIVANASLAGLLRGTWAFDAVRVAGVKAHAVIAAGGALNFAAMARKWEEGGAGLAGGTPALLVRQLTVRDAQLVITDLRGHDVVQATVHGIELWVSNVSTHPDQQADYELTANFPEGGSFHLQGQATLHPVLVARGRVQVAQLQTRAVLPFAREWLRLSQAQASIDLSGRFAYSAETPLRFTDVSLAGTGVLLEQAGAQAPMLVAERVIAKDGVIDTGERSARVGELAVENGRLRVSRARDGAVNWSGIVATDVPQAAGSSGAERPWTVAVASFRLRQMQLAYVDSSAGQPLDLEANGVSGALQLAVNTAGAQPQVVASGIAARWNGAALHMPGSPVAALSTGPAVVEGGRVELRERRVEVRSLGVDDGRVSIVGAPPAGKKRGREVQADPGAPWHVLLHRLDVAGLAARYESQPGNEADVEVQSIDGHLRLAMTLGGRETQVLATGVEAKLAGAALPSEDTGAPAVRLTSAQVAGGRFDLAARRVGAEKVVVSAAATVIRDSQGRIVLPMLSTGAQRGPPSGSAASHPWHYAFDSVQVRSAAIELKDRTVRPAFEMRGTLRGRATNLASDRQASFDASLALEPGGTLSAAGTIAAHAEQVEAQVEARDVPLRPFQALLQRVAALQIQAGTASGSGELHFVRQALDLRLRADMSIANLRLNEAATGDRFLSWRQLELRGASFDSGARRLTVAEASVQNPGAKIVISEDRSVNLVQVFHGDASEPSQDRRAGDVKGFTFEVDRVRLTNGEVDFADLSLVLPFSTTVKKLDGTIVDISNQPSRRASVEAEGEIEPYGSASVEGSIVPAAPSRFTDLHVEFNNVRMPPLSPYTATFAGRKVDSGKLWFDLRYHVEDGELLGKNEIRLQDFSLGERVKSPSAMDIPLDLAVALLTDADGEIHLSVPVTGEVGDAQFSVGSAVRQALRNVVRRIVSAPFRALAKVFGTGTESLGAIEFEPGSARLRPQEVEKLDALTRALHARPRLQLVVQAPYAPQVDARALQHEQARRGVAQALGRAVGNGQDPGPLSFDDPATQRELRRMLRATAGDQAVQGLVRQFAGAADQRELYESMLDHLASAQPISGTAPRVLAAQRAERIAGYLQRQGVDRSRVQTGGLADVRAGKDGEVAAQLQIAAADGERG